MAHFCHKYPESYTHRTGVFVSDIDEEVILDAVDECPYIDVEGDTFIIAGDWTSKSSRIRHLLKLTTMTLEWRPKTTDTPAHFRLVA